MEQIFNFQKIFSSVIDFVALIPIIPLNMVRKVPKIPKIPKTFGSQFPQRKKDFVSPFGWEGLKKKCFIFFSYEILGWEVSSLMVTIRFEFLFFYWTFPKMLNTQVEKSKDQIYNLQCLFSGSSNISFYFAELINKV